MSFFVCCSKDGCGKVVQKDEEAKQKAIEEALARAEAEEKAQREREMREIEAARLRFQQQPQQKVQVQLGMKEEAKEAAQPAAPPPDLAPKPVSSPLQPAAAKGRLQPGSIVSKTETAVEFIALLEKKNNQLLGLELKREKNGDQLVIRSSGGAAIEKWNEGNPQFQVMRADQIVAVNGATGQADELIEAIRNSTDGIELQLRRELRVKVTLNRSAQLGIKLSPQTATVAGVFEGVIVAWNRDQKPCMEIGLGDKLVEVNGCTGTATELQEAVAAISNGESLTLCFERPAVG